MELNIMSQDFILACLSGDVMPSFAEAVKERKKYIAELRKAGGHETADALAKCRKGNRCLSLACPVCYRRRQLAFSRYPELAIRDSMALRVDDELWFVLRQLSVDAIKVVGPRRPLDEKKLAALKASIKMIGLQTPITVRKQKSKFVLVAGWYRLTAMKQLGATTISCFCEDESDKDDSEMDRAICFAENAVRAELPALEKAELINQRRQAILHEGGQVAPPGGHQPKNAGIKKAAKALGLNREDVRRSMRIAEMISPEAKSEARKLGLDDNQDALLQIAKLPPNAQCTAVTAIVEAQRAARARLASRAVAAAAKGKAAAKIQAIEEEIAKKTERLQALKQELTDERDRLDEVRGDLAAAYVNNALISDPMALLDNQGIVTVRGGAPHDQPLSSHDEKTLGALVTAWNAASLVVRDRFIREYVQQVPAAEGDPKLESEMSEPGQG
jgi:ParB family chromosome partitioning protein